MEGKRSDKSLFYEEFALFGASFNYAKTKYSIENNGSATLRQVTLS